MSAKKPNKKQKNAILNWIADDFERLEELTDFVSPVRFLIETYNNPKAGDRERNQAAIALLPYTMSKAPAEAQRVDVSVSGQVSVSHQQALDKLESELDMKVISDVVKDAKQLEGEFVEVPE